MMIEKTIRKLVGSLGYEIIPHWRLKEHEMANHLNKLFGRLEIGTVLDVGANLGQYRDFLRQQVGFEGLIISFEPVAALARQLEIRSAGDPHWHVYPFALGEEDAIRTINVTHDTKFTSFLAPDNQTVGDWQHGKTVTRTENVSISRLDSLIEKMKDTHHIENIYLKLDTQGYDLAVLKGAKETIQEVLALQSEISFLPIYAEMPSYLEAIPQLCQYGFSISGIFPVSTDAALRLVEADCVMIRNQSAQTRPDVTTTSL